MKGSRKRIGSRVRIVLVNGFHYTGTILSEDDLILIIRDKFNSEVSLRKADIQILEVLDDGF